MSTREDREWDAYIDSHTYCGTCGSALVVCDCPDPDLDHMEDE